MSGPLPGRFSPDELSGLEDRTPTPGELADAVAAARELERLAIDAPIVGAAFTDRVMAAIAREPAHRPAAAFLVALGHGRIAAALSALRDSWGVATGSGRPFALRAQAFALVLSVALLIAALSGTVAVGALALLAPPSPAEPTPALVSPEATPSPESPEPTPSPSPEPSPSPSPSPDASGSPEGSAEVSAEPSQTVKPATPGPTPTPRPTGTPAPTGTPEASDDHGGDEKTPEPTSSG